MWDIIVVGGGTAGLPTAIFAARRGAKVLLLDVADKLGGTLHIAQGQLSAAGTKVQKAKGISDTPEEHLADILRISKNTVDRPLVEMAVNNAAETFDWLMDHGFEMVPEHPVDGRAHEPYSKPRYYWGKDWGRSIVKVLLAELAPVVASGHVTAKLSTKVSELIIGTDGAVQGVRAQTGNDSPQDYTARSVVLASGGFAANPELFQKLNGLPLYGAGANPHSQGIGITLGLAAGGVIRGRQNYLSNFGAILQDTNFPSPVYGRAITYPEQRKPWEIYVNAHGQRFIREDNPSVDAREHALLQQPGLRYWIVFDQAILNAASPLLFNHTTPEIVAQFGKHPLFTKADTLAELAAAIGLNATALAQTVEAYNQAQATGHDALGRTHMPAAIATAPFYAIRQQGVSVTSTVGLAVNQSLQVIRVDGSAIPNLYAAGELLGSGQLMGRSFCGGMMGTPALTFGRLLGQKILPMG